MYTIYLHLINKVHKIFYVMFVELFYYFLIFYFWIVSAKNLHNCPFNGMSYSYVLGFNVYKILLSIYLGSK